ncbi:MAG TPA: SGNH hydrolase domain-containing protein [Baekduia sp.]|nr:SGNH hydrolase domain-containing protein [Baekduia sp.]
MRRLPLVLLVALAAWPCAVAAARAPAVRLAPPLHHDARDVAGSPLDLREVTFGQQGAQLLLHLRTARAWTAGALGGAGAPRRLCLAIRRAAGHRGGALICVMGFNARPALIVGRLDGAGGVAAVHDLPAVIGRPDRRTIDASISRRAAGLPLGRFSWSARSHWVDDRTGSRCTAADPCDDAFPDAGAIPDRLRLLAQPRCFGAAAHDPGHPCESPALRTAVIPTPADALITPNAYCKLTERHDLVSICEFGVPASRAAATVVAIGDSHTEHWRGALEVAAQARGWHGISITRASCPLTRAGPLSPRTALARRQCATWNAEVLTWLRRHPEIHTLFVSDHATVRVRRDAVRGYQAAWSRVPRSVRRIVVLRDTPDVPRRQAVCVRQRLRAGLPAGIACAQARAAGLHPDPQVVAAQRLGSPRVQVIDLTRLLCDARRCPAVIGGVLVHKDTNHLTSVFATTLGPYLLRAFDALPSR